MFAELRGVNIKFTTAYLVLVIEIENNFKSLSENAWGNLSQTMLQKLQWNIKNLCIKGKKN